MVSKLNSATLQSLLAVLVLSLHTSPVSAKTLWSGASVSLLKGNDYRVGDPDRTVFTFEHVSGQSWGDSFLFLDHLESDNGDIENYAEFSPRISIGKWRQKSIEIGPIADFLLASTFEMGQDFNNTLLGVGIDLKLPLFKFFQLNAYHRDNDAIESSWQLTGAWALPFSAGDWQFVYDGFFDWVSNSDDAYTQLNFTSQLKLDIGHWLQRPRCLYLGIEYVHWNNKFGIKHSSVFKTHERNVNALIQFHF